MKELLKQIKLKAQNNRRFIISIDGPAASGKSTLSEYLKQELGATVFRMDDYFLPEEMKTAERLSVPGGNVNYERMQEEILNHLHNDLIEYKKYNCTTSQLEPTQEVILRKYIVVEGVYSQQKKLMKYYDYNIFTDVSKSEQLRRLETRNPQLLNKFINEWLPLEENYFKKEDIKSDSDYIIFTDNKF